MAKTTPGTAARAWSGLPSRLSLPQASCAHPRQPPIGCDERKLFDHRLCDQNAIERVAMRGPGQSRSPNMSHLDRQSLKPSAATSTSKSSISAAASGHLPAPTLIAISHALAMLTCTPSASVSTTRRASALSSGSSVSHQKRTCVSSNVLNRPHRTRASALPPTSARAAEQAPSACPSNGRDGARGFDLRPQRAHLLPAAAHVPSSGSEMRTSSPREARAISSSRWSLAWARLTSSMFSISNVEVIYQTLRLCSRQFNAARTA